MRAARRNRGPSRRDWAGLVAHVAAEGSGLLVLPELGLAPWFAASRSDDPQQWDAAERGGRCARCTT